jgi:hypothetical protein
LLKIEGASPLMLAKNSLPRSTIFFSSCSFIMATLKNLKNGA